ncbi:MAG: hydrogenase formation protein HypD [Bacteroidales bacterium]|nr:hydrogenase formation protein HypD [Bacteroidales bacterium]
MDLIDEFRNRDLCETLLAHIHSEALHNFTIMEVCGGHTMALHRFGIPALLPSTIHLLSGPGCPVCVTGRGFIDQAIELAMHNNISVCTYGDLLRVPGSLTTLEKARAAGASIEIIYSPLQCLEFARENPAMKFVFLGIGFETTAPASAVTLVKAAEERIDNFYLLSAHKVMPPAMAAIIHAGVKVDGYLCPGHVSTITGTNMYEPLVIDFKVGCVIAGFEPLDLLQSILMLVRQFNGAEPRVEIQYTRAVKPEGNPKAQQIMNQVFEPCDAWWRGLGVLNNSGMQLRPIYQHMDAVLAFGLNMAEPPDPPGCRCGEVLKGLLKPTQCSLFSKICNPTNPIGACMVSAEGACQSFYKYANH